VLSATQEVFYKKLSRKLAQYLTAAFSFFYFDQKKDRTAKIAERVAQKYPWLWSHKAVT
jgi:hypothetical protein